MENPFIIQIDKIQSVESMFLSQGEFSGLIDNFLSGKEFNLYYITLVEKFRIDVQNCEINNNVLQIPIQSDKGKKVYELPKLQVKSINKEKSTSRVLYFETENELLGISINDLISSLNLKPNLPHEIIYIGQSKDISNRIINHEKLIRAFALLDDSKDLMSNFVQPSFGYVDLDEKKLINFNKGTLLKTKLVGLDYNELINLTERLLINYYQPILNTDFVNTNFSQDKVIKTIKNKTNCDLLVFDTELDGDSYIYNSKNQKFNNSCFILNKDYKIEEFNKD